MKSDGAVRSTDGLRLVLTGGGTAGHVYPALEIGLLARDGGADIAYLGSNRGQESSICDSAHVGFQGFPAEPLYSLKTVRGARSLARNLRSRQMAKRALQRIQPDAVFSTGGYGAGPVVSAARSLRIPYVLHLSDTVPGRSSLLYAREAYAVTCVFKKTQAYAKGFDVIRTGHPLRRSLRQAANSVNENDRLARERSSKPLVLVLGGSQGAEFLNRTMPGVAALMQNLEVKWVHSTGVNQYETAVDILKKLHLGSKYWMEPFIEASALINLYANAFLVVGRSGSSLAEWAAFRIPCVLVPLPASAHDHQRLNAEEFVSMEAASMVEQSSNSVAEIAVEVESWLNQASRRAKARECLAKWDGPFATEQILGYIVGAGTSK